MTTYPGTAVARDRWILDRRPPRNPLHPWVPYAAPAARALPAANLPGNVQNEAITIAADQKEASQPSTAIARARAAGGAGAVGETTSTDTG